MKAEVFRARFDYIKAFVVRSTDHCAVKLHDTKRQQWIEGPRLLSGLAMAQQEALLLAKSHIEGHGDKPAQDADSVKWVGPMARCVEQSQRPGAVSLGANDLTSPDILGGNFLETVLPPS